MSRCVTLARNGIAGAAPNPLVGAVLVHGIRIIGEGYHEAFGGPHAEVNCIQSVKAEDKHLISESTLYVSLEPCSHFGKTPPCTGLILQNKIRKVVVGCKDPFPAVNGSGIEKLKAAGVEVVTGVLEQECRELNKFFFHFHEKQRPFIILKWAQSADKKVAAYDQQRTFISNQYTNRVVHKWRSEVMAIMVGINTVAADNPELTTRKWIGRNPVRIVVDPGDKIKPASNVLNEAAPTIVFSNKTEKSEKNIRWIKLRSDDVPATVITELTEMKIHSVLIEGGPMLIQSFIDIGLWDEARVITNGSMIIGDGLGAPSLKDEKEIGSEQIGSDLVKIYYKQTQ